MQNKKTIFKKYDLIHKLSIEEVKYKNNLNLLINNKLDQVTIALLPEFASHDKKERPLIFNRIILNKIEQNHGKIMLDNFIINANSWDYIIKNVNNNNDKINLIKIINKYHFLTIGANRNNGFFIVTHYESRPKKINTIKNLLLKKGDSLDRSGRAAISSFATFLK